jgi:hypothetical protein
MSNVEPLRPGIRDVVVYVDALQISLGYLRQFPTMAIVALALFCSPHTYRVVLLCSADINSTHVASPTPPFFHLFSFEPGAPLQTTWSSIIS